MTYQKAKEEIIESSPQKTDAGKEELYLYSLRKMAEENVENNRTGLTNLHNINSFFYLCGEMIKQQPDKKYSVIIMDIVQFKAVNEFCGRDEGDRLLRFIASCLTGMRITDRIAMPAISEQISFVYVQAMRK